MNTIYDNTLGYPVEVTDAVMNVLNLSEAETEAERAAQNFSGDFLFIGADPAEVEGRKATPEYKALEATANSASQMRRQAEAALSREDLLAYYSVIGYDHDGSHEFSDDQNPPILL